MKIIDPSNKTDNNNSRNAKTTQGPETARTPAKPQGTVETPGTPSLSNKGAEKTKILLAK